MRGQRVAVYARFSTDKQNPKSIEDQVRLCRERVEREGGVVDDDLIFADVAMSGTTKARPGYTALMIAAQEKRVDVIVCEDLSRIGRDLANTSDALKQFRKHGARLIALDGLDTATDDSKLTGAIRSIFDERYIDDIKRRTRRGMDGLFEADCSTGGRTYGYRTVPVPGHESRKRMEIDPAQADVVRRVFALWIAGHGQRVIAERLNADAVPSPRGNKWSHTSVRALISNDIYRGVVWFGRRHWERDDESGKRRPIIRPQHEWKRHDRPDLRIIDADTWEAAAAKTDSTKRLYTQGARPKTGYVLSGILVCDQCGGPMTIGGGAEHRRYYFCGSHRKGQGCANTLPVLESTIRAHVIGLITTTIGAPEMIDAMRHEWAKDLGGRDRELRAELAQRRAALARTESAISRLLDLIADGNDTPSVRAKHVEKEDHADLQRAAIEKIERELSKVPAIPSRASLQAFVAAWPEAAKKQPEETRELLKSVIVDGQIRCSPAANPENYQVAFDIVPMAAMGLGTARNRTVPSGGCGGALLPLGITGKLPLSAEFPRLARGSA